MIVPMQALEVASCSLTIDIGHARDTGHYQTESQLSMPLVN